MEIEVFALELLQTFAIGAFGGALFGIAGYLYARAEDAKVAINYAKFLATAFIGGVGFMLVGGLGLDMQTVMDLFASAGLAAGGMKIIQAAIVFGQNLKAKKQ